MRNLIVYLIPALFMFLVGNIQTWLKPILIAHDYPEWVYNSFSLYAIIFVACGLLNTYFVQVMKPKDADEKELIALRKKCSSNDRANKRETKKAVSECTSSHEKAIAELKTNHSNELRGKAESHKKEISDLTFRMKAKDVAIESMTNQLAEKFKIIEDYNKETSKNQNAPTKEITGGSGASVVPNIREYS